MNTEIQIFDIKYYTLYYIIFFIVLILSIEYEVKNKRHALLQNRLLNVLILFLIFLFGTRGIKVGSDTENNLTYFLGKKSVNSLSDVKDIGLYFISEAVSLFSKDINVFLITLSVMYLLPIYIGIRNLKLKNPLIFFFIIFSFFFFKSMGINIQRQGIAFSLFFCGVTYLLVDKKLIGYILLALAFLNHASIIIPIIIYFISYRFNNLKIAIIIYVLATFLALTNFNFYKVLESIPIVNILVAERLEDYTRIGSEVYQVGFRLDFWFFNTVFTILGLYLYNSKLRLNKFEYIKYLISYIYLSAFFFLMFSVGYSDRFGVLSWIFIPFLILPVVKGIKARGFINLPSVVLFCCLIATVFMFLE